MADGSFEWDIDEERKAITPEEITRLLQRHKAQLTENDRRCLYTARKLVIENQDVFSNAELKIFGDGYNIRLRAGDRLRKFTVNYCPDSNTGEEITVTGDRRYKFEADSDVIDSNGLGHTEDCSPKITVAKVNSLLKKLERKISEKQKNCILKVQKMVLQEKRSYIWENAQIEIIGDEFNICLYSGERTNCYVVGYSDEDKNEILSACTAKGWRLWLEDGAFQVYNFVATNKEIMMALVGFATRLAIKR